MVFTTKRCSCEVKQTQYSQLMRYRGFRHFKKFAYIAYAHFTFKQRHKYVRSRAVAEYFKQFGNVVNDVFRRHLSSRFFNHVLVSMFTFANFQSFFVHSLSPFCVFQKTRQLFSPHAIFIPCFYNPALRYFATAFISSCLISFLKQLNNCSTVISILHKKVFVNGFH